MRPSPERRLVILAEGNFGPHAGKTARGVIRYGRDTVVAVIDSTKAGGNVREHFGDEPRYDIPIVAGLDEAGGDIVAAGVDRANAESKHHAGIKMLTDEYHSR